MHPLRQQHSLCAGKAFLDINYPNPQLSIPPGDFSQLERHAEVLMHDFAACLLAELERWMLAASIQLFDLDTYVDSPEFTGASALDELQSKLRADDVCV